jgi:hypothetical protein
VRLDELPSILRGRGFSVDAHVDGRYAVQLVLDQTEVFDEHLAFDVGSGRRARSEDLKFVARALGLSSSELGYLSNPQFSDLCLRVCIALAQVAECLPRKNTVDSYMWPRTLSGARIGQLATVANRWTIWLSTARNSHSGWRPIEAVAIRKFRNIRDAAAQHGLLEFVAVIDSLWS